MSLKVTGHRLSTEVFDDLLIELDSEGDLRLEQGGVEIYIGSADPYNFAKAVKELSHE